MMPTIIRDDTPDRDLYPANRGRGLDLSARPDGLVYGSTADPFPADWLIPRSEWQARIEEMEARKSLASDIVDQSGLPCKDQQQTNYCWANATTHTVEVLRAIEGQPRVILSAASVGGQITGYRNVGGMGPDALAWIAENGVVPEAQWPVNAIDPRYATPGNLAAGKAYRVDLWYELEPGNLDQIVSCLMRRLPVAVGLNWWGHEVTYYDPAWVDGAIAIRFRNSWGMGYGQNGYGVLQGRRMLPSDAVAPRRAIAS